MNLAIDSTPIKEARFGRNRLLAAASVALVGLATRYWFPETASAGHAYWGNPCFGFHKCYSCSGCVCTANGCVPKRGVCVDNRPAAYCWSGCIGCATYLCCDWQGSSANNCICRCQIAVSCCV